MFTHVYGHTGVEGNEHADRLANMGCMLAQAGEIDWEALEREVLQRINALGQGSTSAGAAPMFIDEELPVDATLYEGGSAVPMEQQAPVPVPQLSFHTTIPPTGPGPEHVRLGVTSYSGASADAQHKEMAVQTLP